jgi:hypothetical protein
MIGARKHQPWEGWEEVLRGEAAKADEWLRLCSRTIQINPRMGTSYGLKHAAEHWHCATKGRGFNGYIANGCFLMAAHRLGFLMKGHPSRYYIGGGTEWDCHNAYLNIKQGLPTVEARG